MIDGWLLFSAVALALAGVGWWQRLWQFAGPQYPERRRILVTTKTGDAYRGALWEKSSEFLVLKGAQLVHGEGLPLSLEGDVLLFRENVDHIQVFDNP